LPWHLVEKDYSFSGPDGEHTLLDFFDRNSQLEIDHFMCSPGWEEGCKSCSFWADQYDTVANHIAARDVALAVVSRASWQEVQPFKERMEWQFPWVSASEISFNLDYQVSRPGGGQGVYNYHDAAVMEEMAGLSVLIKDDEGRVAHTYSCYSRGLDALNATYQILDLVPKRRDEETIDFTMSWVQHHDRYED
jgi:predicted dithiol-disulfide oxidoreductase (DUF899 family)